MLIQPRQVVGEPKPRSSRNHTAGGETGGRMQVDPMQRCGIGALTLEQVKVLTGIHRPMHVKLAPLTAQKLEGRGGEEGIDLVEDRARFVLHDKTVLQDVPVQGWSWEE